ncbi:MAG: hypothetical protein IPM96_01900 [Ignavibacteria bacterium]|nr:hypothetical protein [Ignavibacteria bacterium]
MITVKKRSEMKTAKGYRLKNSTHDLIEKIQLMINVSKDTIITRAVKLYYSEVNNTKKSKK